MLISFFSAEVFFSDGEVGVWVAVAVFSGGIVERGVFSGAKQLLSIKDVENSVIAKMWVERC